jgi:hypothetical protein
MPLLSKCIDEVFDGIDSYYRALKINFYETLFPSQPRENVPLMYGAVFYYGKSNAHRRVEITENEVYETYGSSYWTLTGRVFTAKYSSIVLGFIFKYIEMKLREVTDFRTKLKVLPKDYVDKAKDKFKKDGYNFDFLRRGKKKYLDMFAEFENIEFLNMIDKIVAEQDLQGISFAKVKKVKETTPEEVYVPVKVEIDEDKLNVIRKESDEILEKLIAIDGENNAITTDNGKNNAITTENGENHAIEPVNNGENHAIEPATETQPANNSGNSPQPANNSENSVIFTALSHLIDGEINAFKADAKSCNVLPEVLAEQINEWALDELGDNVVDENYCVYEDYIEDILEYLKQ